MLLARLFLIACLVLATSGASAIDVVFRNEAIFNSTIVRLGDIADLRDAGEEQLQELAQLPLMPAPPKDTPHYVRAQTIRDLLAAQGHDMSAMRFAGAAQILLKTSQLEADPPINTGLNSPQTGFRLIAPRPASPKTRQSVALSNFQLKELNSQLADRVTDYLQEVSGESRAWRVTLSLERRHAEQLHQAISPIDIEGGTAPWLGPQRFLVSFQSADGDVRFPVETVITEAPMVVLAKRALARGETLTAAALESVPLPEGTVVSTQRVLAASIEELLDREVMRPIRAGEVITSEMYAPPMLVHRGENVTVFASGGGIRIRVLAQAKTDGRLGEIIEVEAPETKERYTARVVGPRQLAVLSVGTASAELATKKLNATVR